MRTKLVKWLCIAVLVFAFVSCRSMADYELAVRVVVCAGAAVVAVQAYRAGRRLWTAGLLAISFLFSPAIAASHLASSLGLFTIVLTAESFAVSLSVLKPQPLLSIPSITDRNPGSESL
jgi:hypothetical protein